MSTRSFVPDLIECRVSSVLNNDAKIFGKKYIFDGNDESCWNSNKGSPQWIQFAFSDSKTISNLTIQFQGGFAGKHCCLKAIDEEESTPESDNHFEFFPIDSNSAQDFPLSNPLTSKKFKLLFNSSTDFYGRIIVYKLDFS